MEYDIIIIGGGAAGMSAAIYACRGGMKTLVIEKLSYGGQMLKTYEVDNYPGLSENPTGEEIAVLMRSHAEKFGAEFMRGNVKEIKDGERKTVITRKGEYAAKAVIFATGANPKKLGTDGEDRLYGAGVSYCATCDGAFFKNRNVAVIGGGNTAFEDSLYLSRLCEKVYVINRSERFRASKNLIERVRNTENIEIFTDTVAESFNGERVLESISLKNAKTTEEKQLNVSGAIIAVGVEPESDLAVKCGIETDENGFIKTDGRMNTSKNGFFAAGDVRTTPLRQIVTAAADGAVAAESAVNMINRIRDLY